MLSVHSSILLLMEIMITIHPLLCPGLMKACEAIKLHTSFSYNFGDIRIIALS